VAYASTDLNLLDDPFSALDAETGARVFSRLIRGPNAILQDSAVVLVTHAAHLIKQVDKILLVVGGRCEFYGTWNELAGFKSGDEKTSKAIDTLRSSVVEMSSGGEFSDPFDPNADSSVDELRSSKLMTIEERVHGLSSAGTWLLWFQRAGGIYYLFFQVLFMSLDRLAYVAVEFFIAKWTDAVNRPVSILGVEFEPQVNGAAAQRKYLAVYGGLVAASVATTMLRSEWSVTGGSRVAKNVFGKMLSSILGAPLSYFETTPIGRLLNRFSYDMEVIDVTLTQNMSMLMISCSWYVAGVGVMVSIIPWMAFAVLPVTLLYGMLLLHCKYGKLVIVTNSAQINPRRPKIRVGPATSRRCVSVFCPSLSDGGS
jgi:ABC-type multidrug transport system fused ATPase/permease subunit